MTRPSRPLPSTYRSPPCVNAPSETAIGYGKSSGLPTSVGRVRSTSHDGGSASALTHSPPTRTRNAVHQNPSDGVNAAAASGCRSHHSAGTPRSSISLLLELPRHGALTCPPQRRKRLAGGH